MFKEGNRVRVLSEKELTRRYAEKTKISLEAAKIKINEYCYYNRARGLVMKKHEQPFKALKACGKEGKVVRVYSSDGKVLYYRVSVKVESQQWRGYGEEPETILVERLFDIPPSCMMFPDFQMEFDFF